MNMIKLTGGEIREGTNHRPGKKFPAGGGCEQHRRRGYGSGRAKPLMFCVFK